MAYDEHLAGRVRDFLSGAPDLVEKRMFGGVAFIVAGSMAVGIHCDESVVRIAPDETDDALRMPGVRIFDITGRPMSGWLLVSGDAVATAGELGAWVSRGESFARSLAAG